MPLNIGDRVGHYEITALLGEGGMGRVYRATDARPRREVALKILPDTFVDDCDRVARFEREAQAVAALNHQIGRSIQHSHYLGPRTCAKKQWH